MVAAAEFGLHGAHVAVSFVRGAAPGPDLGPRVQENLHRGLGENHGADVPALDHAAARRELAPALHQHLAKFGVDRHPGGAGGHLGRADGLGHVLAIEKDAAFRIEDHPEGQGPEGRAFIEIHVLPHRRERHRAHRRPGVEVTEFETFGDRARHRRLAGPRGPVDRHQERRGRGPGGRSRRFRTGRFAGRRGLPRTPPDELPQLVHLVPTQFAPAPGGEPGVDKAADPRAVQLQNGMAEDAQHPPDLAVAPAPEGDPETRAALRLRPVRKAGDDLDLVEAQSLAIDADAALRPLEHVFGGKPADGGVVGLRQPVPGMGDPLRQLPVVGQQHESRAVAVQAPDRNQRAERMRQQIHHRGTASRVRTGRQMADRLVEDHVAPRPAELAEPRSVHPDVLERRVRAHSGNVDHLPVHGDPALGDHPFRGAPRSDPRRRDQLLEPLGGHSETSAGSASAPVPPEPDSAGMGAADASVSSNSRSFGRSSSRSSSNRSRKSFVVP